MKGISEQSKIVCLMSSTSISKCVYIYTMKLEALVAPEEVSVIFVLCKGDLCCGGQSDPPDLIGLSDDTLWN